DNGSGIDAGSIARIFDPFYTTKPPGKGTGLGLAIVHTIVKSHSGYVRVKSGLGKGTMFEVYLPALETPAAGEELRL
ncbi:MAG TPA: ATP-binding protein, partial [Bauldia sp.]|nr:ATP-binding protein [Bauldia sp.]